jgi:FMN phosphatase YigB (HAD superfamily)
LKEYKQETWWDIWQYELVNLKEWDDGRTLEIWILWGYDTERQKQRWIHTVEIEERRNPDYFQEIIKRYNLVIE